MREILFRGKVPNDYYIQYLRGRWVEGSLVHQTAFYGDIVDRYHILCNGEFDGDYYDSAEVIKETVGQFTGLLDKNGRKIFEGDIVRSVSRQNEIVGVMVFHNGGFELDWRSFNEFSMEQGFSMIDSELGQVIIGNIHDNPELLEVR